MKATIDNEEKTIFILDDEAKLGDIYKFLMSLIDSGSFDDYKVIFKNTPKGNITPDGASTGNWVYNPFYTHS